jgi:hypothetical protein
MAQRAENFNIDVDDETRELDQAKRDLLELLRTNHIRSVLLELDLGDIITVLGESDVLEHIGIRRCLEFVQAVGFGPAGKAKRLCRERVAELASSFEYDR